MNRIINKTLIRRAFSGKVLTVKNINQPIVNMEFAVRGEVVTKAAEYEKMLADGKKLPFEKLVYCNIGNPHALKQKPISFLRQVLAVVNCPELLNHPNVFPKDVYTRAKYYIDGIPGGQGAYSSSRGALCVRTEIADFIKRRDGYGVDPENIFLTDGASAGVQTIIRCILNGSSDGLMIPIPQYPLYSATIDMVQSKQVHYYIDESHNWGLNVNHLKDVVTKARKSGTNVKGLCVINPGNPTGTTLELENMKDIVRFCNDSKLVLMADEVYQENLWSNKPFISFKKIAMDLGKEAKDAEIISFHSVSKGAYGECGRRGGYFELHNIDKDVNEMINKYSSVCLCSNIDGQVTAGILVNPPKKGDPSHESYYAERNGILASLKRRAVKMTKAFGSLEGVECQDADGALYAFPKITLPPKAVSKAKSLNKKPDMYYCLELLKETGLVSVPGSGFGQIDGTFHFRSTILPPENELDDVLVRVKKFHSEFMKQNK